MRAANRTASSTAARRIRSWTQHCGFGNMPRHASRISFWRAEAWRIRRVVSSAAFLCCILTIVYSYDFGIPPPFHLRVLSGIFKARATDSKMSETNCSFAAGGPQRAPEVPRWLTSETRPTSLSRESSAPLDFLYACYLICLSWYLFFIHFF